MNSSRSLLIFILVLGFFLIPLWDPAYIRNIDSQLNAVNITDSFLTLSKLVKITLSKVNRYI